MIQTAKDYRALFRRLAVTFYFCVLNFKGGCGKTTTASNLAYYFAAIYNLRVLLIDCDFQAHTGKVFFPKVEIRPPTLTHVLREVYPLHAAIRQVRPGIPLYLLPADMNLDKAAKYLVSMGSEGHKYLKASLKALERGKMLDQFASEMGILPTVTPIPPNIAEQFDIVIFDCAGMNSVIENAFYASNGIYIPVEMKYLSMDGFYEMKEKLDELVGNMGHDIEVLGITPYNIDQRFTMTKEYIDLIHTDFQTEITSPIRTDARVGYAQKEAKSIFEYDPGANFATDLSIVAEELLNRIGDIVEEAEEAKA